MARLTKGALKEMLKECLLEILEERGLALVSEGTHQPTTTAPPARSTAPTGAPVDNNRANMQNQLLKENVNILANSIGHTNPDQQDIFASIFEDTAMNTLQEQIEPGQGGMPSKEVSPAAIAEEVKQLEGLAIDGDIGRWAQVALGGSSKK
jgi:hypothetical protein